MKKKKIRIKRKKIDLNKIAKDIALSVYLILPKSYRKKIEREVKYAGIEEDKSLFCGSLVLFFWIMAIFDFSFLFFVVRARIYLAIVPFIILFGIGYFAPYLVFMNLAEARRKRMEVYLPDILLLMSSNLKSGMTIDRAILFAARPEFGELADEFKKVAFEIYGGGEITEAFKKLTKRIKSVVLERTVKLLLEGLRAGGMVANLLEETANDIRNTEILQREIKSSVMMYVMFIFIAGVVAAPFLFAISNVLVKTTASMWSNNGFGGSMSSGAAQFMGGGFIHIKPKKLKANDFGYFSVLSMIITIIFASMLISIIQTGSSKEAIKYLPIFLIIALGIYFGALKVLTKIFSSMIT